MFESAVCQSAYTCRPLSLHSRGVELRRYSTGNSVLSELAEVLYFSTGARLFARLPTAVESLEGRASSVLLSSMRSDSDPGRSKVSPVREELWSALRRAKALPGPVNHFCPQLPRKRKRRKRLQVRIVAEHVSGVPQIFVSGLFLVVYLGMVYTMMRRMTGGRGKGWGDARKKVMQAQQASGSNALVTRFDDIAGIDRSKLEVQEVVEMLRSPGRYAALGASVPRGVLLAGPPGSGKTLLARATAAEAGVPFLNAAATEFVELFVGRGAARVRQLFERARKMAPCIVFIDEIDALRARSNNLMGMAGGNQEAESTLNQLLTCMDGLATREPGRPVVVIAATNRPEVLDEALLRPGRFDRVVQVPLPNAAGRLEILKVHLRLRSVPVAPEVTAEQLSDIAERCDGFPGAALEAIVNEAAIRAARRNSSTVSMIDFESAVSEFNQSREKTRQDFPWKL
ncbi:ftsH [Symbiodinium sp. CCMP2456]|nr:ftsH [Symbiodinium sp. CCMP2456]